MTLQDWETRWMLDADHLHCLSCQVKQWPFNSGQPFPHASECVRSGKTEYPWGELAGILRAEREGQ